MTKQKNVSWTVFVWAFAIVTLVMGYALTAVAQTRGELAETNSQYAEIQAQLAQIQTDIEWLKLNK